MTNNYDSLENLSARERHLQHIIEMDAPVSPCRYDPDEPGARLDDLETLRQAIVRRCDRPEEAEMLFAYVDEVLSAAEFGEHLGLLRSNGLRRLVAGLSRLGRKLLSDTKFREESPGRFQSLLPEDSD